MRVQVCPERAVAETSGSRDSSFYANKTGNLCEWAIYTNCITDIFKYSVLPETRSIHLNEVLVFTYEIDKKFKS